MWTRPTVFNRGATELLDPNATLADRRLALAKHVPAVSTAMGRAPGLKNKSHNFDLNAPSYRNGWGRNDPVFKQDWQSGWLNSPYQLLQNLERDTAELEAKIKADPDFSDKHKQEFIAGLIDPIKDGNQRARAVDACIMNGAPFPDLKD